jgi:predicted patatin/cPLA2 family phospholipase
MKSILVLEGGALRGIYTAGVLDVLLDNNIEVDAVVGVSAGALFGINYVSKQRGRCLRYNLANVHNKDYMGFHSLLKTGDIMNEEFCFHKLIYETDPFDFKTFNKSKIKFYAVVTNLRTGEPEYKKIDDIEKDMEYLRASGSMPLVSRNVKIGKEEYLDGGMSDSIPIKWAEEQGYDKIIVVETRPKTYRKKKSTIAPYKLKYKKYPKFIETISARWKNYNETKDYIEKKDNIVVIRPTRLVKIKRIEKNKDKIQEMYDLGVEDAKNKIKEIKKYLGKKG